MRSDDIIQWAEARTRAHTAGRAADIGCGTGRFLAPGAVGLDLDAQRLAEARARSRLVVRADAHALPFRDGSFETAYAHRMLNDAERIDEVLTEIRRVLRPGGRLLVFTRAREREGDRLDRDNGAERLARHFERVTMETHPRDDRAAFFVAIRPRGASGARARAGPS